MKESLTVNSFCVISDRTGTKDFASVYVGVPNNKLRPVSSKPGTLYGSAKVRKPLINGLPPCRPIQNF